VPQSRKKHHFVPQFQLRYFANGSEQLLVHRLDREQSFTSSVGDVAHRNYGHSLYWPGREPNHDLLEEEMANLEGHTKAVVEELSTTDRLRLTVDERSTLSWFIALQWHRNRFLIDFLRAKLKAEFGEPETEADRRYQEKSSGLIALMLPLLGAWKLRNDESVRPKYRWNNIVSMLEGYSPGNWSDSKCRHY
jgi:hypothetical protein